MKKLVLYLCLTISLNASTIDLWDTNFYEITKEGDKDCLVADVSEFSLRLNQKLQKMICNFAMEAEVFKIVDVQTKNGHIYIKAIPVPHNCNEIGVSKCLDEPIQNAPSYPQNFIVFDMELLNDHSLSLKDKFGVRFYTNDIKKYTLCKSQIEVEELEE
ncbi:hypothetical protein [Helicobacter bilis]|uniref:hypothetical protein n=1 Tax=Helicobacter bilis TaxID=37372 RepID=UPI0025A951A1|nr:hypothetical protein [Helicobacter bilis]